MPSGFSRRADQGDMRVNSCLSNHYFTVDKDRPIGFALGLMLAKGVTALVVMEGDRLAGVLTEADIRKALPSPVTGLGTIRVERAMRVLKTVASPGMPLTDAVDLMAREHTTILPVLDAGRLVGVLTESSLIPVLRRLLIDGHLRRTRPLRAVAAES
jgi:CBS domain-containing protein